LAGPPKKHCLTSNAPAFIIISNTKIVKFGGYMFEVVNRLWCGDEGQDIAEYAVMLAVILVLVVGTIRLIGTNANNAFSAVASSIAQ
jgi:Flp pilus assembly pilin Flp